MNRESLLPKHELAEALAGLECDMGELVANSQLAGGSSLVFTSNESLARYDWSGTLPPMTFDPSFGLKLLRVIATAANTDNLYGDLIVWPIYINGAAYNLSDQFTAQEAAQPAYFVDTYDDQVDPTAAQRKQWLVVINGLSSVTVGFKPCVIANDDVTISIEELN